MQSTLSRRRSDSAVADSPERGNPAIETHDLSKRYELAAGPLNAVDNINLTVTRGEYIAVVGQSGSGKTTLINLITGIDRPTAGRVSVAGVRIEAMNQRTLAKWRGRNVGVVFQFFQLLPTLTVAENVVLPMDFCSVYRQRERRERALTLLERLGIADQADKFPAYLSGGQQQRAAIARALANDPPLICADEPTGNLDSRTSDLILEVFASFTKEGKTVLMVTHERDISSHATRTIKLHDGRIVADGNAS